MTPIMEIERRLDAIVLGKSTATDAAELLTSGEEVLENWIVAKGAEPTLASREGFRLLALQRQGAAGDPSFNACRETCRELVYHYNLVTAPEADPKTTASKLKMMALVANHLCLFVSGKIQVAGLGEFCCSSKPLRSETNKLSEVNDA